MRDEIDEMRKETKKNQGKAKKPPQQAKQITRKLHKSTSSSSIWKPNRVILESIFPTFIIGDNTTRIIL